jgi:hypothetical protein
MSAFALDFNKLATAQKIAQRSYRSPHCTYSELLMNGGTLSRKIDATFIIASLPY